MACFERLSIVTQFRMPQKRGSTVQHQFGQHVSPPATKREIKKKKTTYLAPILVGSTSLIVGMFFTSASLTPSLAFPLSMVVALVLVLVLALLDKTDLAELFFLSVANSSTTATFGGPLSPCRSFEFSDSGGGSIHPFPSRAQRCCTISSASPSRTTYTKGNCSGKR
jgi:hypothetical protein